MEPSRESEQPSTIHLGFKFETITVLPSTFYIKHGLITPSHALQHDMITELI
jgi:hypothetical protein